MSEQHHHHHHHHRKDSATRFKERSLNAIAMRNKMEKWGKIALLIVAIIMMLAVVVIYRFG